MALIRFMLVVNRYLPEAFSKRIRQWIQETGWRLDFMPAIEDDILREKAKAVIDRWDVDVMREYLPEDDLRLLLANGDCEVGGKVGSVRMEG